MNFIRYQEANDYPPEDRFDDLRVGDTSDGVQMGGLSDLIGILRRRAILILGIVAAVMILALVVVERITPIYEGEVLIQLETRETNVVDIESVLSGAATDTAGVYSERELLMSPTLAARVVDDLDLINERSLSPLQDEEPGFFAGLWTGIFGAGRPAELSPEMVRSIVIARVRENLSADLVGRSRVIRLSYRSPSPGLAARVANGLADAYIDQQIEAKYRATDGASIWLQGRIEELRGKVEEAEAKVAAFRQNAGLVQAETTTITAQQISEINTQLVEARARRAEAEARLRQVAGMKGRPDGLASISEVLGSPLIQQLRKQQAEVEQRASELGTRYGPEHPKMINIAGEISEIRTKISTEVDRIIQGLQNEVQVSRARENSISANLDQLQGKLNGMDGALVELRAMEREAAANRTLYETFVARFKETSEQRDLQQSDSQIFSRAEVPLGPVWPRRDIILIGALSAGLILALAIVFAIEHLDHGFRSVDQIEQMTGRSALGIVPQVGRGAKERVRVVDEVADGPSSMFSESIRTILTALLLTQKGGRPKIVLFTSSVAKEGKTTLAASVARTAALSGQHVLIVDCDLRRPALHEALGLDNRLGLVELITGKAKFAEVHARDDRSKLIAITAGGEVPNPADLLGSRYMSDFLDVARENFDLVVLDSPPLMAVADARVLASKVDRTVLAVRWAETRRDTAAMSLRHLAEIGAANIGIALTRVDARKHAHYAQGDSGYYHRDHRGYYGRSRA